jgi:hypothetical protein
MNLKRESRHKLQEVKNLRKLVYKQNLNIKQSRGRVDKAWVCPPSGLERGRRNEYAQVPSTATPLHSAFIAR